MLPALGLLVTVLTSQLEYVSGGAPLIDGVSEYYTVTEELPFGSSLFVFTANDPDDGHILHVEGTSQITRDYVEFGIVEPGSQITVNVTSKHRLDRETFGKITLSFKVADNHGAEVFKSVDLYLIDINDNPPTFQDMPYRLEIPELPYNDTFVFDSIYATDPDNGADVIYQLEPNAQSNATKEDYMNTFSIDSRTGDVTLLKSLDYSNNSYYQFTVIARDRDGPNSTTDLIIRVIDVQNKPPFFTGVPYRTSIQEHEQISKSVLTVNARDGDTGLSNPVNYTIRKVGECYSLFNISVSDGQIYTAIIIDRDVPGILSDGVCVLQVMAQEIDRYANDQHGSTNATTDITVTVVDLNDNAPKFNQSMYFAEIQENAAVNLPLTLRSATEIIVSDADANRDFTEIKLSLQYPSGELCQDFKLVPSTVQKYGSVVLRVNRSEILDFEQTQNITILIVAQETENENHTATANVTVTLLDMNDNNPQFNNASYEFSVYENWFNQTAGTINATDEDSGNFGSVVYSLSGGNNRFIVDAKTGTISTTCTDCSTDLDREKVGIYYMTFTATDMNGMTGGRSNSTSLVVHVLDLNDNAPTFIRSSPVKVFVDENDPQFNETALVELEARDDDEPGTNNSDVWYNILSILPLVAANNITINKTTGHLHLVHPLDFEKLNGSGNTRTVDVVVAACDKGTPMLSSNITVIIEVQDMNDNTPHFKDMFTGTIYENETSTLSSSAVVGRVQAEDDDGSNRNSAVNYYILSGSSDKFRINSSSGEVSVQVSTILDRETTPNYTLIISAIDQGSPPLSSTTSMTVQVLDVNDDAPMFNKSSYSQSVKENTTEAIDKMLIVCHAHDRDEDHDLLYLITPLAAKDENGNSVNISLVQDYFWIDPSNGTVFVKTLPDRETAEIVELELFVKDLHAYNPQPQNGTSKLIITILDINDNKPSFTEDNYTMEVSENALDSIRLDRVQALDRDKNRTITYNLTLGPYPTSSFKIDRNTGTISKVGELDRETNASVDLYAIATDNGVPQLSSSVLVTVNIIDFNDNAPAFMNNETAVTIKENSKNGTRVIQMHAKDDDIGVNAEIKFNFGNEQSKFVINETMGLVEVSGNIDREETQQYTLQIVAKDQPINDDEQKTSIITITVYIEDVNDNSPSFEEQLYHSTVMEVADVGSTVMTLIAIDRDDHTTPNANISYGFLNDTKGGLFALDELSGIVTVNQSLLGSSGSYVLNVTAIDHGSPPLSGTTIVNITVQDINLNTPNITNPPIDNTLKVYECTRKGYVLYNFTYHDADKGINKEADFNISEILDDTSAFRMVANGSLVLGQKLNYRDKNEYQFQVFVTDRGIPKLTSEKLTLTVKVIDVDDNLPSFSKSVFDMSVKENELNVTVGTVTATDLDMDSVSCYSIIDGEWSDNFTIGNLTGIITTTVSFDREGTSDVHFNVSVKDCSIPADTQDACDNVTETTKGVTDNVRVNVRIIDIDDNPPLFINKELVTGIRRTTEVGSVLELKLKDKLYVSDLDSDEHGIHAWRFEINGTIGISAGLGIDTLSGTLMCQDGKTHIFCIWANGSITSNRYFSEDLAGYFNVPVRVADTYGSDVANVRIYLIGDSQVLLMVVLGSKENVSKTKDEVLKSYSDITKHTFVYDGIADHKTPEGLIDTLKTDLYFHVVEPSTQRILSSAEAIRLIDSYGQELQAAMRQHKVIEVTTSIRAGKEEDNKARTIYILAAVVAALAVSMIIIVYVAVTTKLQYQKKLKAAMTSSTEAKAMVMVEHNPLPGSNVYSKQSNPLLNSELPPAAESFDNLSLSSSNSLDENAVGEVREPSPGTVYDSIEEREVIMDMFTEDTRRTVPEESPLDAALRLHEMQTSEQNIEGVDYDMTDTDPEFMTVSGMDNEAFIGDLESTEI